MSYPKKLIADPIRVLAFGGIAVAYAPVGTLLLSPARIFCLNNLTNVNLMASLDGVNDHFILPPGGFKLIDCTANRTTIENFFVAEGTIFYVRDIGVAAASGSFYVEVIRS